MVPRKGQRLTELETSPALMRACYPSLQVRSDNGKALEHVLTAACEQVHLEYSTTWLETPASDGRGEKQCQSNERNGPTSKRVSQGDAHHVLLQTPCLSFAQHSDWILNHQVRNAFLVEGDYRAIKT